VEKVKSRYSLLFFVFLITILAVSGCTPKEKDMPTALLPAGMAFAEGNEIFFVHTEVSDAEIATLLSNMMSSPVLLVPGLADSPESALAEVYVFTNGLEGKGPLGFQADVFDNPPGSDGYSPLRRLNVVTWTDPTNARLLKSSTEVLEAKDAGEISIEQPGVVVNMPFVVWDGGKR
jgi:hypothetical protein